MFVTEGRLHAGGLGLILFSPSVLAHIPDGADFMADLGMEPIGRLYDKLVLAQRVVLLGTGSPQIDYCIRAVLPPETAKGEPLGAVEFGLWIEGGILAIRDGYEPMHWSAQDRYELRFRVPDGYHRIRALCMQRPEGSDADMHIDLVLEPTSEPVPGDGWPMLMHDGSLQPALPAERPVSEITLEVRAAAEAIPAALHRALHELAGTFRVAALYANEGAEPGELDAFATRTQVSIDRCDIGVVVFTPFGSGGPLRVEIVTSATGAANKAVLLAAANAIERALAAIGTVVERSRNF